MKKLHFFVCLLKSTQILYVYIYIKKRQKRAFDPNEFRDKNKIQKLEQHVNELIVQLLSSFPYSDGKLVKVNHLQVL